MNTRTPLLICGLLMLMLLISGCVTVKPVTYERVDQEVSGNQGFLMGDGDGQKKNTKTTKTFIKVDIDLSRPGSEPMTTEEYSENNNSDDLKKMASDTPGDYNKGYFEAATDDKSENFNDMSCVVIEDVEEVEVISIVEPTYDYYVVKKGETLWDIAGRPEVYGNSSKWKIIFEANKDKIRKPSLIKPGMKLKIPR
ncbi:MAG: LysM peptidoglycan-binding domain-containing protein [Candidatus Kappaea frigidicola]|nr:LysM peptidoglycan-binding domain-containing protein [Candidatus Kappaea frigidicola]